MPAFTTDLELWKGLTDLPLILAPVILFLLMQKKQKIHREWKLVFLLLAVSAAFGTAVHCLVWPQPVLDVSWTVLFAVMFELVRAYAHRVTNYICREERAERAAVRVIELILYLAAVAVTFSIHAHGIYAFVIFAALLMMRMIVCAAKSPDSLCRFWMITAVLAAGLIFQAVKSVIPCGVVLGHAAVLIALFMVYKLACDEAGEPVPA